MRGVLARCIAHRQRNVNGIDSVAPDKGGHVLALSGELATGVLGKAIHAAEVEKSHERAHADTL
jgi:hypothetical protein